METRAFAEDTIPESSHVRSSGLVIDDRPIVVHDAERRGRISDDDPVRTIRGFTRRWRLLLAFIVVGSVLGWLSATLAEETSVAPVEVDHYQASHVLVLDSNVPATQAVLSVRNLNTLAKRVTVGDVPDAVAARTDLPPVDVGTQVRVIIRSDSESLDIVTIAETPGTAEELADAFAAELFAHLDNEANTFATEAIASAQARLDEAELNLASVRAQIEVATDAEDDALVALLEQDEQQFLSARIFANASLLDARADGVPVVPLETLRSGTNTASVISEGRFDELVDKASLGQNVIALFGDEVEPDSSGGALSAVSARLPGGAVPRTAAGAALGLMVGFAVLAFLNRVDNRVRSKRQVEDVLDLPVISEVPSVGRRQRRQTELLSIESPRSRFAEQHRALASTISYAHRSRPGQRSQVVLVTSPGPAEGKTTTVANLGAMLAESGESVLLINCDFRRPRLHLHLDSDDEPMNLNSTSIDEIDLISNVLDDPDAPPTEVIAAQRKVIAQAREVYDLIVIDTAPVLATNDAVDLLDLVDDVVLVLRAGKTTIHAADRAAEILERRRAHVLGLALTAVDARSSDEYYYYGSYYNEERTGPSLPKRRQVAASTDDVLDLDGEAGNSAASASLDGVDAAEDTSDLLVLTDDDTIDVIPADEAAAPQARRTRKQRKQAKRQAKAAERDNDDADSPDAEAD